MFSSPYILVIFIDDIFFTIFLPSQPLRFSRTNIRYHYFRRDAYLRRLFIIYSSSEKKIFYAFLSSPPHYYAAMVYVLSDDIAYYIYAGTPRRFFAAAAAFRFFAAVAEISFLFFRLRMPVFEIIAAALPFRLLRCFSICRAAHRHFYCFFITYA